MRWPLVAVFALTYAALSARRALLPRPALALVGAVLLVTLGSFSPSYGLSVDSALHAVEPRTLALLFGSSDPLLYPSLFAVLCARAYRLLAVPARGRAHHPRHPGLVAAVAALSPFSLLAPYSRR